MSLRSNKSRGEGSSVRRLERMMAWKDRLFGALARRRGALRLRRILLRLLILIPVLFLLALGAQYALDKAYGLSIDRIVYKSRRGILTKERALALLGLHDTVNIATLNTEALCRRLEKIPGIRSAVVRAELPDTLYIEVEERIPIAYVELEYGALIGNSARLFTDPEGVLFPVQPDMHAMFLGVPTWYLRPEDATVLAEGVRLPQQRVRTIARIVAAANNYSPTEIPPIVEIFRPKDWKLRLILDNGAEITMEQRNIKEQMDRLAMILEHARATHRRLRSANVIPSINPVATFDDAN